MRNVRNIRMKKTREKNELTIRTGTNFLDSTRKQRVRKKIGTISKNKKKFEQPIFFFHAIRQY